MKNWQEDMLSVSINAKEPHEIFDVVESAAHALGFDYCSYGIRFPVFCTQPETIILSNYPDPWKKRYIDNNYQNTDPVVMHAVRSQLPLIWSDEAFASATQFWDEAQSFGLRFGWSQSNFDFTGIGGLLSLSRSTQKLTERELRHKGMQMSWLTHVAHHCFCRAFNPKYFLKMTSSLSKREIEVLKWAADGKYSHEIAQILDISKSTVDFHIKNAMTKLRASNKTAAVVRAAMLGLLDIHNTSLVSS